jgi:predicted NAD/FAD-binding protein
MPSIPASSFSIAYPNFIALLDELDVRSRFTEMGFSVRCDRTGLEYNGSSLNS